ncbi:transcription elongation factor Spt5, partial [Aureobasidium melanogenum]
MSFLNQDFGDASDDEEEFNPAPAVASDDEADNNDDNDQRQEDNQDDDDDAQPNARRSSAQEDDQDDDAAPSRSRATNDDDDEEEDDEDEEDDEEDEEDEDIGHPRKRRRKGPRNQFLDVEAEVDDEDEEEPDEDDEIAGEEMHPDDLLELPAGAERDDRKHRELDRQRDLAASMDAEKQAQALKERYGRNRAANVDSAVVPQRLLLPSVDDPKIWRLKCKPGKEREVVFAIMKRIEDRAGTREPLQLISAFERGGVMAGNLYCEARHVEDVTNALEGLQDVYMGTKPMMVPITEMPDLLRTRKSKALEPGMYVRVKRGKYAGDLAQIDEV